MDKIFKQLGCGAVMGMGTGLVAILGGIVVTFGVSVWAGVFSTTVCAAIFWLFWKFLFAPMRNTNMVLDQGEAAEATILSIYENGSSLKLDGGIPKPGVTMNLEVRPVGRPAYKATIDSYISMFELSAFRAGKSVRVKIDRKKPHNVVIDQGTKMLEKHQHVQ